MAGAGATGAGRPEPPGGATADSSSKLSPVSAPAVKVVAEGAADEGAPVSSASAASLARQTLPDPRQKLYADPLVQRIFEEFDARLVEIKTTPIRPDGSASSAGKK